ncbi:MAG: hypothetical protein ACKOPR_08390 [Chakrabartia godavariana]
MKVLVRLAAMSVASLALSGCFLVPGKFGANVDIRKAGDFSVAYKGEIIFQMPDDIMGLKPKPKPWDDAFAICYASGRTDVDEFSSKESREAAIKDAEDPSEGRDADALEIACSARQIADVRAKYETEKAAAAAKKEKESDEMAQLFGFSGSGDEANEKFAAALMKYEGWKSVTYRGKGTFDVDYRYTGKLTHDFIFPIFPKMDMIFPFIMIRKRADGAVMVTAPSLIGGGMKAMATRAKMLGDASAARDLPEAPRTQGLFTVTTNGEILSNNSEDGPSVDPQGKKVVWDVNPMTDRLPEVLIRIK